jgi:hypothetical protein
MSQLLVMTQVNKQKISKLKFSRGYYPNYLHVDAMPLSFVRHNDLPT